MRASPPSPSASVAEPQQGPSRLTVAVWSAVPSLALGLWLGSSLPGDVDAADPAGHQPPAHAHRLAAGPGGEPWHGDRGPRGDGARLPPERRPQLAARAASSAPPPQPPRTPPAGRALRPAGAEGYGPQILAAYESGDADAAWDAFNQLQGCAALDERQAGLEAARGRAVGLAAESWRQQFEQLQGEQRRCQTVTPQLAGLAAPLAQRAMRARIPGAAAAYARVAGSRLGDSGARAELLGALSQDAWRGDAGALQVLAASGAQLGAGVGEQLSYALAQAALAGGTTPAAAALSAPLSAEEEARAREAARRMIEAARSRR